MNRLFASAAVLVTCASIASAQKVAIVAAAGSTLTAGQFTDPQAKLIGTGLFPGGVDLINAGSVTPTLTQLLAYDAVMVWSNLNFLNAAALGDVLADYVDAGGGVVVAVFANSTATANRFLTGRWQTGGYEIIPAAGGTTSSSGGAQSLGTILVPGHPTLNGVAAFNGGSSSFRPTSTTVCATCTKVALWTDGKTLIATHDTKPGRVDLGMYPPSAAVIGTWWVQTTDGARLMANALLHTIATPVCCVDFNNDMEIDFSDIEGFLAALALMTPGNCKPGADFNNDGEFDFSDVESFLAQYNAAVVGGC